jgi:hypothetical protein
MELKNYFAQTSTGTVISGATFYVYLSGTTTLATIYDKSGVALANPSTATTQGLIQFKAVDGSYDITVISGSNSYTIPCTCFDGNTAFRECLRRSYAEAGYTLVDGSFEEGGTLTSASDVLLYKATGVAYAWYGAFPKVVAAGSTPATSGGVGAEAWVDRTDVTLRDELALDDGAGMVGTSDGRTVQERLDNIPDEVDAAGTAAALISQHNSSPAAHPELSAFISAEADRAEAARDAAQLSAGFYATTAAGLAATTNGKYFSVPSAASAEYLILYLNNAGVAQEVKRYPSAEAVYQVRAKLSVASKIGYPDAPMKDLGLAINLASSVFVFSTPVPAEGWRVSFVNLYAAATGNITISAWSKSGDTFTRTRSQTVSVPATGYQEIPVEFFVLPGEYLGLVSTGQVKTISGTKTVWYSGTYGASFVDATTTTQDILLQFVVSCDTKIESIESTIAANYATLLSKDLTITDELSAVSGIGYPSPPTTFTGGPSSSGYNFVFATPVPAGGYAAKTVHLYATEDGTLTLTVWSRVGDTFTQVSATDVAVVAGYQSKSVNIAVQEGQYLGFRSTAGRVAFTAGSQLTPWYSGSGTTFTDETTTSSSIALRFEVSTFGLRFDNLEDGVSQNSANITALQNTSITDTRFSGKKVYYFGDSITQGTEGGYVKYVTNLLRCTPTNYGSSGAATSRLFGLMTSLPTRDGTAGDPSPDYTDVAAVTIMIGTNGGVTGSISDIPSFSSVSLPYVNGFGVTISTIEDHINQFPNTYFGNIGACIEYVRYKNPKTLIYLITPVQSDRSYTNGDFYSALKEISDLYSVRLIDARNESGVTKKDIMRYSYDGTHMNVLGNELLGKYIGNKILYS